MRRRPTTVAAAAPNRISIGGAGTSVPPVVVDVEPPEDVLEELEPEVDELVEDEVLPPELPELDEDELEDEEPLLDELLDE